MLPTATYVCLCKKKKIAEQQVTTATANELNPSMNRSKPKKQTNTATKEASTNVGCPAVTSFLCITRSMKSVKEDVTSPLPPRRTISTELPEEISQLPYDLV